jgi:hypothetical protein
METWECGGARRASLTLSRERMDKRRGEEKIESRNCDGQRGGGRKCLAAGGEERELVACVWMISGRGLKWVDEMRTWKIP